jgi:hypothetical protein
MIDVDEDQGQRQSVAPRPSPLAFQELKELLVVGNGRQRIFSTQPLQLDASGLELRRTASSVRSSSALRIRTVSG